LSLTIPGVQGADDKSAAAPAGAVPVAPKPILATAPVPREGKWLERHESINQRVKEGNVDLVFIGDSITQGWEGAGKEVWAKLYTKRNAANLGISGDRTQHVLWRLEHGNIEGIKPKVAVIMIGTNNVGAKGGVEPVAETAAGVTAIVQRLRDALPEMKIMLLGIFPRGQEPNLARGEVLQINQILNKLHDGKHVWFVDFGYKLIEKDGSISKTIMPDYLHLSQEGYQIWADAIEPKLVKLLGEKQ